MLKRGNISVEGVPEPDEEVTDRLNAYQNTRNCSFQGFLPGDMGILISTRFANSSQIHQVRTPMGARKQLTFFKEPVKGCHPAPEDACAIGFTYGFDRGGDENIQFCFFDMDSGKSQMLTDGKSKNQSCTWNDDGSSVAFSSNARNGKTFDVWTLPFDDDALKGHVKRTMVMQNETPGYHRILHFYGQSLLVEHYVSVSNSSLYVTEASPGSVPRKIAPSSGEAAVSCAKFWIVGGKVLGVAYASNEGSDFMTLRYYDLESGKESTLFRGYVDDGTGDFDREWDVEDVAVLGDTGLTVAVLNIDGASTFFRSSQGIPKNGPSNKFNKLDCGHSMGVAGGIELVKKDGELMLGYSTYCATSPMDCYHVSFKVVNKDSTLCRPGKPVQWTEAEVGGLNTQNLVTPELIRYKSFDGLSIGAFVYRPKKRKHGKIPVIIHPHGGPEGQHRPRFVPMVQFLASEMGVCVIDPNVRGSDGYGKVFVNLDNGKNREDSVKDIGALLDWVAADPDLDETRTGVWGGSYGGYMVLACLVHYSDRLCCGINMVGISNFVTFLENTSEYRRDLRRVKYGDERDPDMRAFLEKISPLTNADKINKPLFIVQGANDPRVPLSEAVQIKEKVSANGKEVWYMVASDEGHGFAKKSNVDQYQAAIVAFCNKFLL